MSAAELDRIIQQATTWPEFARVIQQVHDEVDAHRARLGLPPHDWANSPRSQQSAA